MRPVRPLPNKNDGGMLFGIATAHSEKTAFENALFKEFLEQRLVWVPFHFLPGDKGDTLERKLVCQMDSPIAREMVANNLQHALGDRIA